MVQNTASANLDASDVLARCALFNSLNRADRDALAAGSELRTIRAGSLLFAEGDTGKEMYVLIDGVLEAFKQVADEEVILDRQDDAGAHVGERALLETDRTRRASVRSLCDSRVLAIPKAVFLEAMQRSPAIEKHMNTVHRRQLEQLSLLERSVMYRALVLFDQQHGWSREEHYEPGAVIVAEGDPASVVYVVRKGSVKRSRVVDGEEVVLSMVQEGQTFGGVALLEDRPHSAAAIAVTEVDLVSFDREQFLQATATTPELHEYLGAVNRVYAMSGGLVTLFEGEFRGQPAFVTVTRLDDGREVIVRHVIDRAIYSASVEIPPDVRCDEFVYRDDKRGILRVLTTYNRQLMRVHAEGPWEELSRVHNRLLERTPLVREALRRFTDSGYLWDPSPAQLLTHPQAILCRCLRLTRVAIESAIAQGAVTLEDLSRETGATTVCGACTTPIATLFSSAGQAVSLSGEIEVTRDVRSFRFTPCRGSGEEGESGSEAFRPALPGQHVVVSAEIDGLWVQRPYTITSPAGCTEWREITVKREDHGFLSNWLFSRPQQPRFKLSHPKGDLRVDPTIGEPVVCLVAGIGMTPALAIARSIDEVQGDRRLHIDYSARTQVDFAYRKELDELAARHDNITVQYRATGGRQRLDPGAVQAIHARWPGAQYLVCGPIGYMKMAEDLLLAVGVKPERVHLEVFKSVGHAPLNAAPEWGVAKLLQLGATLGLCVFYLLQAALGWDLGGMTAALQQSDTFLMTTGGLLMAFIGYQWYLPFLRLTNRPSVAASRLHVQLGVLAPILLYLHSVSLGFAYTVVLSLLFIGNTVVGAVDKTLIRDHEQRQRFQRVWLLAHVPASFLVTALTLIHVLYALAYK